MAASEAASGGDVGLPPGTLRYTGDRSGPITVTVIDYTDEHVEETAVDDIESCFPLAGADSVTWVNIDGVHQAEVVETVGRHVGLHPLVMEDILNPGQRPKLEDFDDYLYIIFKMLDYDEAEQEVQAEQVSLLLGPSYVISFQEKKEDIFGPVRERIRNAKGRIRKMGSDYLLYALMDTVVDHYFLILERIGSKIESIEEELVADPRPETLQVIQRLKRDIIFLRKTVWPLREIIGGIERRGSSLIDERISIYFRDVYDHTIQVIDAVETYRDMISGMLDIYLSSVSNRMNEVMKVLTVIATIFIPLTFIAGIYGMNFAHMPELGWQWSYPIVWLVMASVAVAMLLYFRQKEWL